MIPIKRHFWNGNQRSYLCTNSHSGIIYSTLLDHYCSINNRPDSHKSINKKSSHFYFTNSNGIFQGSMLKRNQP